MDLSPGFLNYYLFLFRDYLHEVIKEALRFKRRNLAELLEKNIEDLITQNGVHVLATNSTAPAITISSYNSQRGS